MLCPNCKIVQMTTPAEHSIRMCVRCADTYGVGPMLPPRRPARPCAGCNGLHFIRSVPRELAIRLDGQPVASPMTVTYARQRDDHGAAPIEPRAGMGYLELYICRKCGLVEWFCSDPERVPIGPGFLTEAIDYGKA